MIKVIFDENTVPDEKRYQQLYWESQLVQDKLFSLEHYMRRLVSQGKTPCKSQKKYFALLDELREIHAEMILYEKTEETVA